MSSKSLSPSHVAIALSCAGALAFACGPRAHSEPASSSLASAASVVQQGVAHSRTDATQVTSRLDVKVERETVQFALHLTNQSRKHVELFFPNGQTHEFVVVDSVGREIWRWSASRLFTQAVQNRLLSSNESIRYNEEWKHPTLRGKYTVIATLNSTNFPVQERADFIVP